MPLDRCKKIIHRILLLLLLAASLTQKAPADKPDPITPPVDATLPGRVRPLGDPAGEPAPLDGAVGPNTRVNDRTLCPNGRGLQQNEAAIAVAGPVVVIAYNDARGTGCPPGYSIIGWSYSFDGGDSFIQGEVLPQSRYLAGDPWLGVSPDGRTVYLSGLWQRPSGLGFYRGRIDKKAKSIAWDDPVIISLTASHDKEAFAVDPNSGTLYLAYSASFGLFSRGVVVTRSTDEGDTWAPPVTIFSGVGTGAFPVVNSQGHVYVAYNAGEIQVSRSADGGQTFQHIAGFPARTVFVPAMDRSPSFPQMAVDRSGGPWEGRLYVVWHALSAENVLRPYLSHSSDNGDTWSTPVAMNTDAVNTYHWWPSVSVDDAGRVNVIFLDRRRNPGTAQTDLFFAQSTDGGRTFANLRVTDIAGDWSRIAYDPEFTYAGDYICAVSQGTEVYATWTDPRQGDPDIYFSRIDADAVSARDRP